ncbi:MAG TPA: glycosyltransferase [Symbiobacteriaceae bacterium]|jgi:glycosyltransferase involved in cell wall biosynthesis
MISVIIPTWNEERTLPNLLRLIAPMPEAKEVVVVDGGSRDRTAAIAQAAGATSSPPPGDGRSR